MKTRISLALALTLTMMGLVGTLWTGAAEAIPAFARKEQAPCNVCHTTWPMLTATGRQYKENGYTFVRGGGGGAEKTSEPFGWEKIFPITALINARPYDKKDSGDAKMRAIHEIELMVAGQMYGKVSGWFELESEDEENFEVGLKFAAVAYHHSAAVNVQAAWATLTWIDPYDTYSTTRRMTGPNQAQVINQTFGGADRPASSGGRLRDSRQVISLSGRPLDRLFYSLGITGVTGDAEGVSPATTFARLAFDVSPNTMVGLLAINGTCEATITPRTNCTVDRKYSRVGVDLQSDLGPARLMAVHLQAEDDNAGATATVKNKAWYVQGTYAFQQGGRPTWVPLMRLDYYEQSNGVNVFKEGVFGATYYFTQNIKGSVEYMKQLEVPTGQVEDKRFTLQLIATF